MTSIIHLFEGMPSEVKNIRDEKDEFTDSETNESNNETFNIGNNNEVNHLHFILANVKKKYLIAQGNYGEDFQVKSNDNTKLAAKTFYMCFYDYQKEKQRDIVNHMNTIKQLNHPSILKCYDYNTNDFGKERRQTLLTDYCSNGSLRQVLLSDTPLINNTKKLIIIYGIASGLQYLHSHKIFHYDLKTETILLDGNFHPKINDVGFSRHFHGIKNMAKIKEFSSYTAPEYLIKDEYTSASEVYSFALIVYEIVTNKKPFGDISQYKLLKKLFLNHRPYLDESIPNVLRDLIENCWSQDPDNRLTFEEICKELNKKKS